MFDAEVLPSDLDLPGPDFDDDHGLPADLETIPPGLLLAVILSSVDRDRLSGFDRVSLLKARARLGSWIDAELYADIEAVSGSVAEELDDLWEGASPDPEIVGNATASEVQAALSLTRRSADIHVELAFLLCERLPRVWEALHAGLIDLPRARILSDLTMPLPRTWLDRCVITPWNVLLHRPRVNCGLIWDGSSFRSTRLLPRNDMSRSWTSEGCSPNRVRMAPPI
jgi:hypothetical protein